MHISPSIAMTQSSINIVPHLLALPGNLHFNVTSPEYSQEVVGRLEPFFYELVGSYNGSISAEHGLGFIKNKYMHYSRSEAAISTMRKLKHLMDPAGILNPYKTLPPEAV